MLEKFDRARRRQPVLRPDATLHPVSIRGCQRSRDPRIHTGAPTCKIFVARCPGWVRYGSPSLKSPTLRAVGFFVGMSPAPWSPARTAASDRARPLFRRGLFPVPEPVRRSRRSHAGRENIVPKGAPDSPFSLKPPGKPSWQRSDDGFLGPPSGTQPSLCHKDMQQRPGPGSQPECPTEVAEKSEHIGPFSP